MAGKAMRELVEARFEALEESIAALKELKTHDLISIRASIVAQKEHEADLREADQRAIGAALAAAEKAVAKAEEAMTKRLEGLNELRGMVSDQSANYPSRDAVDAKFEAQTAMIDAVKDRMTAFEGIRRGMGQTGATVVQAITIGVAIIAILISVFKPAAAPVGRPVVYGGTPGSGLPATVAP